MLMALLLLSWMWDRVVTNCSGGTERIHHYYLRATMFQVATGVCGQGGQKKTCTINAPAAPVRFGPDIGDPGTGTTVTTYVDALEDPNILPTPPIGGLAAWPWPTASNPTPVMVVDMAGHINSETCQ